MYRTRAWRRHKNYVKAKRKQKIDYAISGYYWKWYRSDGYGFYRYLHQYSKSKIHCSCAMCSAKTRNKGKRRALSGNYAPSINYKISDRRKQDKLDFQLKEFEKY